ncbi:MULTISPECIES: transglutaminase family protein [unclassified Modicisalibacter]|uniref:transglutaminase-like domain-containing protein n=1 Tax=unclassified Modicisalibacter TaxID=2679913 RepID=UPI001CCFEDC8|nr:MULTISPECIES: transglutaminase family protein [unclassified Modicisalibacter]MBZ9560359.1 transglutaminase family protein [Modicisalibacter sp. R2A 31.J]MBZ9576268.1 transglutaminase family protein [Modicisalibacter sp. MOD 31.J]
MRLRIGYEIVYECPQAVPMIVMTHVHYSRASDLVAPDYLVTLPPLPSEPYRDSFGNWCVRLVAPPGRTVIATDAVIDDPGQPDRVDTQAPQLPVERLPAETLLYLIGSRYCETDRLSDIAWQLFGNGPTGWQRVQAICDFVHRHISFGYPYARATKSAWEVYHERGGVCRDFAHLAVAFCRAMNIPARYCTGYLSDIDIPPPHAPMDFHAWFEAYLDGGWYTFDPRNNDRRVGRILIAYGRDAADVPIANTFGPNSLVSFRVWTHEDDGVSPLAHGRS